MSTIKAQYPTNFTPSTERVRDRFIANSVDTQSAIGGPVEYGAAFDRWLTSVTGVRTVTTEEEYEALPVGSIVRGDQYGQVAERVDESEDGYRWCYTGSVSGYFENATIARNLGEATVLYVPA